jgi:hypothetical protein
MLLDMSMFAFQHQPPSCIILISGDRDFSLALHRFAQRMIRTILIVPHKRKVNEDLLSAAFKVIDYESIIGIPANAVEQEPSVEMSTESETQMEDTDSIVQEDDSEAVSAILEILSSSFNQRLTIQALRARSKLVEALQPNMIKKIIANHPDIFKTELVVSVQPEYTPKQPSVIKQDESMSESTNVAPSPNGYTLPPNLDDLTRKTFFKSDLIF